MSYEIAKPINADNLLSAGARESTLDLLPKECSIPGYWSSLAQNTDDWAPQISVGPLWRAANSQLDSWQKEYRRECGGTLLVGSSLRAFVGKSEDRIKQKVFEKIDRASSSHDEAKRIFDQSMPIPRLEDLVRARQVVQYLDGVPFLAKKLFQLAHDLGLSPQLEAKGNLNGYFAQHLTFRSQVFFNFGTGAATPCNVTCEVQIATSLATHVWENSHPIYETTRVNLEKSEDWQWHPNDPRFLSRQLGHMIHLADGLFCNLRDKSKPQ
jgi:hypothetical protein